MRLERVAAVVDDSDDVPEFVVSGIDQIENLGGNLRFTLYQLRNGERAAEVAVIIPTHLVRRAAFQAVAFADGIDIDRVH